LSCLINNRGWVVTHEQLLHKAWGPNYIGDRSFVKLYIRYLRQKLEKDPQHPKLIVTERGIGYRFLAESN
jgi:two-component system KDP operon response regulator KdpE